MALAWKAGWGAIPSRVRISHPPPFCIFMDKILQHFKKTVGDYDTVANKVVMEDEALQQAIVEAVGLAVDTQCTIIDLGCGTGHGMKMLLDKFVRARVIGIDFSDRMIEKAQKNLVEYADRIELIEADFRAWAMPPAQVIVSGVAIHNISHEEKSLLFKNIYSALAPGGVFINGDFIAGESIEQQTLFDDTYRKFLEANLEGEELSVWIHHAFKEDMPLALSEQGILLKTIGFKPMDVLWQHNNEAVYRVEK